MTAILPTRVSLYDFLLQDTALIDALLADSSSTSILQARLLRRQGLQAIISALLAYEQRHGADTVQKKLLTRGHVKELREHNAFNLATMATAMRYSNATASVLFRDEESIKAVSMQLAQVADTTVFKARKVLGALSILALREIAILADFSCLDADDVHRWFELQPQFMVLDRTSFCLTSESPKNPVSSNNIDKNINAFIMIEDNFNNNWHAITSYKLPSIAQHQYQDNLPNYAKVMGRLSQAATDLDSLNENSQTAHEKVLVFVDMPNITLPHSRWLLQLAKIADTYLGRNRLKIAPEPQQPPPRPLLDFSFISPDILSSETTSETPIYYEETTPFWKNRTILLILFVIGGLFGLSFIKFQYKTAQMVNATSQHNSTRSGTTQYAPDLALVRIHDDEDLIPLEPETDTKSTVKLAPISDITTDTELDSSTEAATDLGQLNMPPAMIPNGDMNIIETLQKNPDSAEILSKPELHLEVTPESSQSATAASKSQPDSDSTEKEALKTDTEATVDTNPKVKTGTKVETNTKVETGTKAKVDTNTKVESNSDAMDNTSQLKIDTASEAKPDPVTKAEVKPAVAPNDSLEKKAPPINVITPVAETEALSKDNVDKNPDSDSDTEASSETDTSPEPSLPEKTVNPNDGLETANE